jgi:hypothetical protein
MVTRIFKKSLSAGVIEFLLQLLELLPAIVVIAVIVRFGTTSANGAGDPLVAELGEGFVSGTAQVNGTSIHYVRGGTGPALILVHGFPQDWYALVERNAQ